MLLYLMAILCHINHGVLPRLRLLGSAITAIYILYIFCCSQIFLQLQQVLKTGNSNWHLPVICIILRERLFHFGLGNDADRTCHAAGFCAALLIAKILHGDGQKLLLLSSPVSMLLLSWLLQLKRANMRKKLGANATWVFCHRLQSAINMRKSYFPISYATGAPIYSPISTTG